jgi:hypothetical protein
MGFTQAKGIYVRFRSLQSLTQYELYVNEKGYFELCRADLNERFYEVSYFPECATEVYIQQGLEITSMTKEELIAKLHKILDYGTETVSQYENN